MYRVESLTRTLSVDDLGITISPNLPKVISPEDFSKSLCLAELVRQGHLRVSKTSLCREEVPAKPGPKRKDPPTPTRSASKKLAQPNKKPTSNTDLENVNLEISESVVDTVKQTVADTVKQTVASSLKQAVEDLVRSAIDSVIRSAIEKHPLGAPLPRVPQVQTSVSKDLSISGEAPMFIPSGIVPKGASGEISVVSETQTSESLGDSASALKKLRKGASK